MAIRVPYPYSLKLRVNIACNLIAVYAIGIKSLKTGQVSSDAGAVHHGPRTTDAITEGGEH